MTSPISDTPTTPSSVGGGSSFHDHDPKQPIGEVAVVESESEVSFGGGAVTGELGIHLGFRVEEIRVFSTSHTLSNRGIRERVRDEMKKLVDRRPS